MDLLSKLRSAIAVTLIIWRSPPSLTISQWADQKRKLSPESSAEPGQFVTDRAPYQRGMMDAYNDPTIKQIVFMTSAQIGKTEIINNIVGYVIDQDPGPLMLLQPTLDMAKAWSKDRLAPMLRDTPCLHGKVKDPRSRDSDNTVFHKVFPGGHITMAGSNSPASLASRPIRIVLADEVDRYPVSAGTEGDPVNLVKKRTKTFWNRKIILTSTPTIKGASRIEIAYEESDKRRYYVPCPHCKQFQHLQWSQIKWDRGPKNEHLPTTAVYVCEHCNANIEEKYKYQMLREGEWRIEGESKGIAGFHINELYSPWSSWPEIIEDFLASKPSPETLKTWVNTTLGETFEEQGDSVNHGSLFARREQYQADVPQDALVLVCGVDHQDDRLEYEVKGYGLGFENWGIEYGVIYGDPAQGDVWIDLDAILQKSYKHESGAILYIGACCIDSGGHHTQMVYDYVKRFQGQRVFATKGVGGPGRPIVSAPSKKQSGKERRKVDLFTVGVDSAKSLLYSNLRVIESGPGYCHYPMAYTEEYFLQLTAEKCVTKFDKGFPKKVWIKTRPRNEALDISVLCDVAIKILNPVMEVLAQQMSVTVDHLIRNEKPPTYAPRRRVRSRGINQ